MRLRRPLLLVALLGSIHLASCGDGDSIIVDGWSWHSPYVAQTAPESVLVNLQIAYCRKEIEQYARLLAPEFIFKFQGQDVADLGLEDAFWYHDEDSTGTRNLFATPLVSEIRIALDAGPTTPSTVPGHPPGTMNIRILQTQLEIDQTDGTTWVVSDQQDMFFRRGLVSAGEDTSRWFLMEWWDLDSPGLASVSSAKETTWGKMKSLYKL
jgi:hypothetical protein